MNILVTGGTGSFGRAFVRYALGNRDVDRIVVYSRDEWKQAEMAEIFPCGPDGGAIRYFLGDVRDRDRLKRAMVGIDFVVHAAALKRVDAVAYNPSEVVKTNVLGTMNVVDAALDAGVRKVLFISSDKAVNPINIYGASKFMAEQYAVHANSYRGKGHTAISVVRWGNVMGSRGSVVNTFRDRAAKGLPLQITNPECTRFFITLPQAVCFTWNAHKIMDGGEIYVPKLKAFKITDLALAVDRDNQPGHPMYSAEIVGLRPGGEKIHERLINEEEMGRTAEGEIAYTVNPRRNRNSWNWMPEDYLYTSDTAPRMTVSELKAELKEVDLL